MCLVNIAHSVKKATFFTSVDVAEALPARAGPSSAGRSHMRMFNREMFSPLVMPGLGPGIHVCLGAGSEDADGRDKPGHDDAEPSAPPWRLVICNSPAVAGHRPAPHAWGSLGRVRGQSLARLHLLPTPRSPRSRGCCSTPLNSTMSAPGRTGQGRGRLTLRDDAISQVICPTCQMISEKP